MKEHRMIPNVSFLHNCYGCGVCSSSCPKQIISMKLDRDGFYTTYIADQSMCIKCGVCLDVCAFIHKDLALENPSIQSWAAWSNSKGVRRKCSSGGIGFEIGSQLIGQGYKAVGCRYNNKEQRAEHFIATTVEEYEQSIGSKYLQSYTEEAFKSISRKGDKYLVTGTPCQIDSFRRMIRQFRCEENFILMDFYCHCVPSMHAWNAYIKMLEPKIGKVTYASWRNKIDYGRHDSCLMGLDGEKTSKPIDWHDSYSLLIKGEGSFIQSRMSQGDLFFRLFLGDMCLGPQCQNQCKYKYDRSSADIRIGDLWGKTYQSDQKGVSALVAFTEKGRSVVKELSNVTLIEHPFDVVAEGQMKENAHRKTLYPVVMFLLRHNEPITAPLFQSALFLQRLLSKIGRVL